VAFGPVARGHLENLCLETRIFLSKGFSSTGNLPLCSHQERFSPPLQRF